MRLALSLSLGSSRRTAPPVAVSLSPAFGAAAGDTIPHTLTGTGLSGVTSVTVGGAAATFAVVSDTQISITQMPARTAGLHDVVVTRGGQSSTLSSGYRAIGIAYWRRAGLGETLNSTAITAYTDRSGNAVAASQGSAALQPTYVANDAAWGVPSHSADGGDVLSTSAVNLSSGYTMFTAVRLSSLTATNGIWSTSADPTTGNDGHCMWVDASGITWLGSGSTSVWYKNALTTIAANTKYLIACTFDGATITLRKNGAVQAFNNNTNTPTNTGGALPINNFAGRNNASYRLTGTSPELIVTSAPASAAEITAIESYLNSRLVIF